MILNGSISMAKVSVSKDINKILDYFRYKTGTTLDAMIDTGILRNSITWYVSQLEKLGLLQAVFIRPDNHTGYKAKYYSADPNKWRNHIPVELSLFGKEVQ